MKKIILLASLLLLTGCSSKIEYEFKEDIIESNIEMTFNIDEYKSYQQEHSIEYDDELFTDETSDSIVQDTFNNSSLIASFYKDKYYYYNNKDFKIEKNKYIYRFTYKFKYDEFKDNYYIKDCFDSFNVTEDNDYIYYKIKGKYTCSDSYPQLIIKGSNKIKISNATIQDKDEHLWKIKKDNDIYFVISKHPIKDSEKSNSRFVILIIAFIGLLIIIAFNIAIIKHNQNS